MSKVDLPVSAGRLAQLAQSARRSFNIPDEILGFVCAVADALVIVLSMVVAQILYRDFMLGGKANIEQAFWIGMVVAALFVSFQYSREGYAARTYSQTARQMRSAVFSWASSFFVIAWFGFLMKITDQFSRGSLTIFFVLGVVGLLCLRFFSSSFVRKAIGDGRVVLRKAFVVTPDAAGDMATLASDLRAGGVEIVGAASLGEASRGDAARRRLVEELRERFAQMPFQEVYLLFPWQDWTAIRQVSEALRTLPLSVYLIADDNVADIVSAKPVQLNGHLGCLVQRAPLTTLELVLKRAFDVFFAGSALLMLSPLLVLTALAILLQSGRPVIFRQERKGFGGRSFTIFKFRTMTVCENGNDVIQAQRNDARTTWLGSMLRRSSIDELPQLINVLRGDMSIVGPRPHAMAHDTKYHQLIASYAFRHHVKPGLTGWAQVNGLRGETRELHQMESRVQHDLWYIDNWSFWLDMRILVRTASTLLFDKNAY